MIWEDIESYKLSPGLYPFYEDITYGLHKIYNTQDLLEYFDLVENDYDPLSVDRQRLCNYYNDYSDGNNTQRVVDFIIQKANL